MLQDLYLMFEKNRVFRLYVETKLLILNIERRPNFTGFSVNVRRTYIYMLSRDNYRYCT